MEVLDDMVLPMKPEFLDRLDALSREQKELRDMLDRMGRRSDRIDEGLQEVKKAVAREVIETNEGELQGQTPNQQADPREGSLSEAIDRGRQKVETVQPPPIPSSHTEATAEPFPVTSVESMAEFRPQPEKQSIEPNVEPVLEPAVGRAPQAGTQGLLQRLTQQQRAADHAGAGETEQKKKPAVSHAAAGLDESGERAIGEWELNFGQVWLVRIGVVFLLTGLVFLSTYAYKNWLFHSGPAVKVAFFMVISLALTGSGFWLEQWKERFKQYGRVVASGGLAAGYYTLYAAHFTPSLKIVESPVLAGMLLTVWAGCMLAYAVWKKSKIVSVMAIGLAFYGTVVNPAGVLSLFSSLLLASAAMWLMLRYRWVGIGLATVVTAYLAHAFWLGYYPGEIRESVRLAYLGSYWLLFTGSLAVPQAKVLGQSIQRAMAAINNTSAWGLTVFVIPSMAPHPQIGWISMGMGVLWLGLSAWIKSRRVPSWWDSSLVVVYGYQGVLIISLGILLEATGYTRFLVLAVEACILLAGARYFGGVLARFVSAMALLASVMMALPDATGGGLLFWPAYAALALVYAGYTALVRWDCGRDQMNIGMAIIPAGLSWIVIGWGVCGQWAPMVGIHGLWGLATVVMLAYFLMKKPWWLADLAILSIFPACAAAWWFLTLSVDVTLVTSLLPISGAVVFWWMSPRLVRAWDTLMDHQNSSGQKVLEWLFSVVSWAMVMVTVSDVGESHHWLWAGGVFALMGHGVSLLSRRPSFGVPAICLYGASFVVLFIRGSDYPLLGWTPAVLALGHLLVADLAPPVLRRKEMRVVLSMVILSSVTVHAFQQLERPDLLLTGLGVMLLVWAQHRDDRSFAIAGAVPALLIACVTALGMHGGQDWGRYLPVLVVMVLHGMLWFRRKEVDSWQAIRSVLLTCALLVLFVAASRHVQLSFDGSGLSICWALLAVFLFCLGLMMRCRPYRLVGLAWLGLAVAHVVAVDVMRLGTLGRILSFITLGLVLLVLGFLYNRFQETIRKFL